MKEKIIIPNENFKMKIIGRNGCNIETFQNDRRGRFYFYYWVTDP